MGKASIYSRKTARIRQLKRQRRQRMQKETEMSNLQVQFIDYKKNVEAVGEQVIDYKKIVKVAGEQVVGQIQKVSQKNNNLLQWINIYTEQIENQKRQIFDYELKLYKIQQLSSSSSSSPPPQSSPQSSSPQPSSFKSLDEYFKWENNQ